MDKDTTLINSTPVLIDKVWRPISRLSDKKIDSIYNRLTRVEKKTVAAPASTATKGPPKYQVTNLSVTESPLKRQDRTFSEVSVSFTRDPSDAAFGGVKIWFTGYKGVATPVLVADGRNSPLSFLVETTGETVVVTCQAAGSDGSTIDFAGAPTTTVLLDGVISAPPAPSISQSLVATPLGYQFAFTQVSVGSTQDVIDSYRVYKFTADTPGSAALLKTFKHDPTSVGAIVVQDNVGGGNTFYYWVTSVNTVGLESAKTAAQSGAVISGTASLDTDVNDGTTFFRPANFAGGYIVVQNGNFEASASLFNGAPPGFVVNGPATLTYETATPQSGTRSLKVVTSQQYAGAKSPTLWRVTPGEIYKVSGFVKSLSGATALIQLAYQDSAGLYVDAAQPFSTSASWVAVSASTAVPAGAIQALFNFGSWDVGGGTTYFDNLSVTRVHALDDEVADGTTYGKVVQTGLTSGAIDPSRVGVLTKGSIPPVLNGGFTYTATATSVTWSWPAQTAVYRADGTVTVIGAGTQAVTGLTNTQVYEFYPIFDEATQTLKFLGNTEVTFPNIVGFHGDGTTGYATGDTSRSQMGSFSAEIWICGTSIATQPLFDLSAPLVIGTAGNKSFHMYCTTTAIVAYADLNTAGIHQIASVSGQKLNDGVNHHIVLTWDNATFVCAVYVDGVLQTNADTSANSMLALSTMYWHIGAVNGKTSWGLTTNTFAANTLSNAAIYSTVLTLAQVQTHYQSAVNISLTQYNTAVAADSPLNWWKLNETSGTAVTDSGSAANNGTYRGTVTLNNANPTNAAVGSPAIAYNNKTYALSAAAAKQSRVPLSSGSIEATASAGGGGGGGGSGGGGGGGCFTPNTRVQTWRGNIPFSEIVEGDMVLTAKGTWLPVENVLVHDWNQPMLDMGDGEGITYKHPVCYEGQWQPGVKLFGHAQPYEGIVMNLEVKTNEPEGLRMSPTTERSYTLANGLTVHNAGLPSK
jgi:hypothetical protein